MNKVTDAILLKETASRGHVALTYGVIGLVVGAFFLGSK